MKEIVVFIVGPTGVGKSAVALSLAKKTGAEIISCDSMQVYRGMDIGTAKLGLGLRKKVRHHLINIVSPRYEFSCADFSQRAKILIKDIIKRGHLPLLVGGSGLYVKALVDGLFAGPSKDQKLRDRLEEISRLHGVQHLYQRLKEVDPCSANKIHPNDKRRIIRSLEVYEKAKIPISRLKPLRKGIYSQYKMQFIGLTRDRQDLYARINQRVDRMFDDGLTKEVEELVSKGMGPVARQAIGYKEVIGYLDGQYDLKTARDLLKKNTRHFAKRQLSWFRYDQRINWVNIAKDETVDQIVKKIMIFSLDRS